MHKQQSNLVQQLEQSLNLNSFEFGNAANYQSGSRSSRSHIGRPTRNAAAEVSPLQKDLPSAPLVPANSFASFAHPTCRTKVLTTRRITAFGLAASLMFPTVPEQRQPPQCWVRLSNPKLSLRFGHCTPTSFRTSDANKTTTPFTSSIRYCSSHSSSQTYYL